LDWFLIEVMACGTPVIAFNRGSVPKKALPLYVGLVTKCNVAGWLMVRQESRRGQVMDLTQAFLLGIMVAWTPSLIVLAVLLRDIR
jgi:hypothetical protein